MQCHEYEGFCHIRSECHTYLKKKIMGWHDGGFEGEHDNETTNHKSDEVFCNQALSYEELNTFPQRALCQK